MKKRHVTLDLSDCLVVGIAGWFAWNHHTQWMPVPLLAATLMLMCYVGFRGLVTMRRIGSPKGFPQVVVAFMWLWILFGLLAQPVAAMGVMAAAGVFLWQPLWKEALDFMLVRITEHYISLAFFAGVVISSFLTWKPEWQAGGFTFGFILFAFLGMLDQLGREKEHTTE